jgi:hypothetical protein
VEAGRWRWGLQAGSWICQSSIINHRSSISSREKYPPEAGLATSPRFATFRGHHHGTYRDVTYHGVTRYLPWGYAVHTLGFVGTYLGVSGHVPTR